MRFEALPCSRIFDEGSLCAVISFDAKKPGGFGHEHMSAGIASTPDCDSCIQEKMKE